MRQSSGRCVHVIAPVLAIHVAFGWASVTAQEPGARYPQYKSTYSKRGDVHGLEVALPVSIIHEHVIRAFANLELTVNDDHKELGFVQGGRSRGIAGEIVRVWIDPGDGQKSRVEVRNIRISRMGLLGYTATKDWSELLLVELARLLEGVPSLDALRTKAAAEPESLESQRELVQRYAAMGLLPEATTAYEALLAKHAGSVSDRIAFADLLLLHGKADQAVTLLSDAPTLDSDLAFALARISALVGRPAEAVSVLSRIATDKPDDLRVKYSLARASLLAGDSAAATTLFSSIIAGAPDHPFAASSKLWLANGTAITSPDATEPRVALAVGQLLTKENLGLLGRPYLRRAVTALPDGREKYEALKALTAIDLDRAGYKEVVDALEPRAGQLGKANHGELLHALSLAYCGLREFPKAVQYNKMAAKAKYEPAKALKDVLETYM